jgi:UDP-glucuronate 4-epimerase
MKKILITGDIGFIGFHLAKRLLEMDYMVIGIDNHNDYYDPSLKAMRLDVLRPFKNYTHYQKDINDISDINESFDVVIHLAAQAGVRYSLKNPNAYTNSNLIGFMSVLEYVRKLKPKHFIFASSSSVYGMNDKVPFSVEDEVNHPVSLYAATKRSNELLAHSYAHLYQIPTTGLRFFTVYGPYGRPDMAYFSFTEKILKKETIQLFNHGDMYRDFTYIDDIVSGIINLLDKAPKEKQMMKMGLNDSKAPYKIYNLGNNQPVTLKHFVESLESALGQKAIVEYLPMQPGDVYQTYADIDDSKNDFDFKPKVSIEVGLKKFIEWYIKNQNT